MDVIYKFKAFIQDVQKYSEKPEKLTSLVNQSIYLLNELPAARELLFEYFAKVADITVQDYVKISNVDLQTGLPLPAQHATSAGSAPLVDEDDDLFLPIQEALEDLVTKGPSVWGTLVSSWSLELVGNISEKYAKRKMTIGAACNYWLNCNTMRGLLTLISVAFRKLTNTQAESFVETLLAAFQRYSVCFDWVVARLGGCFPLKIITQILQYSLKRFAEDFRSQLDSENSILDYLSCVHEQELKMALREMLQDGVEPKKNIDVSIIPFLMVISNYSDRLLQHLTSVFLELYTDDMRATIIQKAPLWMSNKLFADMQPSLNNIVLRLKSHGATLLILAAKMADQYIWCQDFLEFSLQEFEQVVLNARLCSLMDDLETEDTKYMLWKSCVSTNLQEQQTAVRLLLIASSYHAHIYHQTISELMRKSYALNPNGIGAVVRIMAGQSGVVEFPEVIKGLQMVLEDVLLQEQLQRSRFSTEGDTTEGLNTFKNLNTLTKMQKRNYFPFMRQYLLTNALNECLPKILNILDVVLAKLLLNLNRKFSNNRDQCKTMNNKKKTPKDFFGTNKKLRFTEDEDVDMKETTLGELEEEQKLCSIKKDYSEELDEKRVALAHTIIELLNTIDAGSKNNVMRTTEVLKLAILSVKYFFIALTEKSYILRSAAVNRIYQLLKRQCSARKAAKTACLRELIEGSLFYYGFLFGQFDEPDIDELEIPEQEMVLMQNQRHNLGPNANRTILHAGIIGRGLRTGNTAVDEQCDGQMQALLLKALDACCLEPEKPNSVEGYSMISLLLVELVSTDVMYNGLPFPDEDFTKVTMERDLLIRRAFVSSPVLWGLLGYIAAHRPALSFSSVLLRALCATCLHQWRAKNVNKFQPHKSNDELMCCTKKLLQVLSMGQLLPPPLSQLHHIIEYFEPPEIALLLKECIWSYLKDHVPSPALFQVDINGLHWRNPETSKIPAQYVDTLRNLMQKKLTKLGAHYHQMFIMPELNCTTSKDDTPSVMEIESV